MRLVEFFSVSGLVFLVSFGFACGDGTEEGPGVASQSTALHNEEEADGLSRTELRGLVGCSDDATAIADVTTDEIAAGLSALSEEEMYELTRCAEEKGQAIQAELYEAEEDDQLERKKIKFCWAEKLAYAAALLAAGPVCIASPISCIASFASIASTMVVLERCIHAARGYPVRR